MKTVLAGFFSKVFNALSPPENSVAMLVTLQILSLWGTQDAHGAEENLSSPFPLTVLVINKENHEIFVYPSTAVEEYTQIAATLTNQSLTPSRLDIVSFKPMPELPKILATETEINSLNTPLAKRAAVYAQTLIRFLTGSSTQLVTSPAWSQTVLKVIERFAFLDLQKRSSQSPSAEKSNLNHLWPIQTPLSMSILAEMRGILAVIEARSDTAAGVVEQIDLIAFDEGKMIRTYWSRSMHDPTLFKQTDSAINQVTSKFIARLKQSKKSKISTENSKTMSLKISRLVPDFRIAEIQKILEKLSAGNRLPLIATNIDRDFITYSTPVRTSKVGEFKAALKRAIPDLELGAAPPLEKGTSPASTPIFEILPLKNDKVQINEKNSEPKKKANSP